MTPAGQPAISVRRLASELRRLRSASGLAQREVQARTGINPATLSKLEQAQARPQRRTLLALIELYGASDEVRDHLLALLKDASRPGLLAAGPQDPGASEAYAELEAESAVVSEWAGLYIPGLLQTPEYARAVTNPIGEVNGDAVVETRMRRREEVLLAENPLELRVVLDEAALHRQVGGPETMSDQLASLEKDAHLPNVTIQVLPYDRGAHAGMLGGFTILDSRVPGLLSVAYVDSPTLGDLFVDEPAAVERVRRRFARLQSAALSATDSRTFITSIRKAAV